MTSQIPPEVIAGDPFNKWELTIKESFDFKELYKRIHEYLVEEGFSDMFSGGDDFETYYHETEAADGMKTHKIWWRAEKFAKSEGHDNIKFYFILDFTTQMMVKKEIMHNGQKVKLDNGELKLECEFYIDFEANKTDRDAFSNHFIMKYFKRKMRTKYNRKIESLAKGEVMVLSNDLYDLIQVFVGARPETDLSRRDFYPIKGIGN